jgi:(E)-4-hydroxy-3-methylbut-2-enyl-diphosphate synthase
MLGDVPVGGGAPVTLQSMTNTNTADVEATLGQIRSLEAAGCEIVRVAVPDGESAAALSSIVNGTGLPVVADIHFDYRLALESIERGVAGIRINPGTMGGESGMSKVARALADSQVAVRVGVNSGSLEKRLRSGRKAESEALAASALEGVEFLESHGVRAIKVSVKASDVTRTIEANERVAAECPWPLHVGVTEAGTLWSGTVRSAVGLGAILARGIGDTIRVSLTARPEEEVRVGRKILEALQLRKGGPLVISCPTCARAEIDVIGLATRVEEALAGYRPGITVAVMGCAVNGPGEAREADVGIAGGRDGGTLFAGGRKLRHVPAEEMFEVLVAEVEKRVREMEEGDA